MLLQFATGLSLSAYVIGATLTNKETEEWQQKLGSGSWWRRKMGDDGADDEEIYRAKTLAKAKVSTIEAATSAIC